MILTMKSTLQNTRDSIPPCLPPIWAKTGHLQTILGHLLPSPKLFELGEEFRIPLNKSTEFIHTTYIKGTVPVVVYLFHGLGGDSESAYMQRTALVARSLGYHVFINNHRGCGKGMGMATEPYHSGRAEDISKVIAFGRQKCPEHKHVAVGFSLSANALLLLAARVRAEILPDMAIAVNGPIHLDRASIKLTQGLNRIYDKRFVLDLKQYLLKNSSMKMGKVKDLRDFDEIYTAPRGGFKDRAEYYDVCSAKQYLKRIEIPTVLLTAKDDPFVGYEDYEDAELSSSTVLHIEKWGGHMGYLDRGGRWLDQALKAYLQVMKLFLFFVVFSFQVFAQNNDEAELLKACSQPDMHACEKLGAYYLSKSEWDNAILVGETLCTKDLLMGCTFAGSAKMAQGKIQEASHFLNKACDKFEPFACRSMGRLLKKSGDKDLSNMYFKRSCFYGLKEICSDLKVRKLFSSAALDHIQKIKDDCAETKKESCDAHFAAIKACQFPLIKQDCSLMPGYLSIYFRAKLMQAEAKISLLSLDTKIEPREKYQYAVGFMKACGKKGHGNFLDLHAKAFKHFSDRTLSNIRAYFAKGKKSDCDHAYAVGNLDPLNSKRLDVWKVSDSKVVELVEDGLPLP